VSNTPFPPRRWLAELTFVQLTRALEVDTRGAALPPTQAALIAAQHHGLLIIAIMIGAVVGMIGTVGTKLAACPEVPKVPPVRPFS
jgi:hypothetical protein